MELRPIRSILVIGGGTAGWMSALYLNRALGRQVPLTLVESPAIGTIGVGEASFNLLARFFEDVGLTEPEWMPPSQATYKLGIKFVDWNSAGRSFFHPFQRYDDVKGLGLPEWWLHTRREHEAFDRSCFTVPAIAHAKRAPRTFGGDVFETRIPYPYAYHFDAGLLAAYLREVATRRGVRHVQGTVGRVDVSPSGNIETVHLDGERSLNADLVIDCTGFRGHLVQKALGEHWHSFGDSLFCDRALAVRIPHGDPADGIKPYTTSTALSSGWVWDIPLKERTGTGYVYSSRFLEEEAALTELRRHLGRMGTDIEPNVVRFRCGRLQNSWVANCVAVGLSSSFVEPLESTAIFTIQYALLELVNHLPNGLADDTVRSSYNRAVGACVDGIRDFLIIHYYCSDRRDTLFWEATKNETRVPAELGERLALWHHRLPNPSTVNQRYHGFYPFSYTVMMLGLSGGPSTSHPLLSYIDPRQAEPAFAGLRQQSRDLLATLPSHADYLAALYEGRLASQGSDTEQDTRRIGAPAPSATQLAGP